MALLARIAKPGYGLSVLNGAMPLLRFHLPQFPAGPTARQPARSALPGAQFPTLRQPFASMQLCIVRTLLRVTMPSAPS